MANWNQEIKPGDLFYSQKLCTAASKGNLKDVELSLENGANLEYKRGFERLTPLLLATKKGHLEVVTYLVTHGSQLEAKSRFGQTPLMWAAEEGHLEVVTYLVTQGSQLEATESLEGQTPLISAAKNGHLEVVTYLVTQGSQLEATDTWFGYTALHHAAQNGQIDVTKWLIDQGCSPFVKSKRMILEVQSGIPKQTDPMNLGHIKNTITENAEDVKQHISMQTSQTQQIIKESIRKEMQESLQHAIRNLSVTVLYDRQDRQDTDENMLVPQDKLQDSMERPVLWHFNVPREWDLEDVVVKLKDPTFQDGSFTIKFVKKGSLIMMTTISAVILRDQEAFETAVKSFLNKMIEVCKIDTKVHAQVDIRLHILTPNEVGLSFEVPKTMHPKTILKMENRRIQTEMTIQKIEDPTAKTKLTENNNSEEKTEWMMNLSISVAIFSLVVVVIVSVSKCCSKVLENKKNANKEITGKHQKISHERKTNIYGTYGKQTIANDDDEYEFDSDNYAEDPYAVIRDSQILPETSLVGNDLNTNFSPVVNHLDDNFYTSGYNHLHLMGRSYKHGKQHDKMRSHSRDIYGTKFPTFLDME